MPNMSENHGSSEPPLIADLEAQPGPADDYAHHPDAPIDEPEDLEVQDNNFPTPRFMEDEGAWKKWRWVPYPVRRFGKATAKWVKGPQHPQNFTIDPFFPAIQHAPLWLLDRFVPKRKHRIALLIGYLSCWLLTFALVLRSGLAASDVASYGKPQQIGCGNTYWLPGYECGVDGNNCRPFDKAAFAFKCPANCLSYRVLNARAVGDQEIAYKPWVIGGPPDGGNDSTPVYRGDSFICGAAIHAGVISDAAGGCGVVRLVGQGEKYTSSKRHGIKSIEFDSWFPKSFTFDGDASCKAKDVRWSLLAVSVVFTAVLSLFTTSAPVLFFAAFTIAFWQVGMASDAPPVSPTLKLFTVILGKFLPAMFCAWVFYDKMGVRRALKGLNAQIEKTVLWVGGLWVGALTNYTLDFIPIQRLNAADLQQQPGAKMALALIILVLFAAVVSQIWFFRQEGRLPKYLKLYGFLVAGILFSLFLTVFDLHLRIHHYIIALLLLPGTSMQTRLSLLFQGFLVGQFINGIARWDFAPILETSAALLGDAPGRTLLPDLLPPVPVIGEVVSNITFQWGPRPPLMRQYDGMSVLVNDVERFRTYFDDAHYQNSFTWERNTGLGMPEYFRFAYMGGSKAFDYTKAGVWDAQGNWHKMKAGAIIKRRSLDGEGLVPDLWNPQGWRSDES